MDISTHFTVHGAPDAVAETLLSEELAEARMKSLGVSDYSHKREGDVAVTDCRVGVDRLPDAARRFVKNGVHVTMTARKSGHTVDYSFDMHGLPAAVSLSQKLSSDGDDTRVDVDGEVKVKVPIMGAKLEKKAAGYVLPIFKDDAKIIEKLLKN
ncbi:MAG: DUF2505 domain-containing protein [Actinomycetaceae bacterium]|nr:DUF2505 domain-containing protein [Actinomycetaceae bacterium]